MKKYRLLAALLTAAVILGSCGSSDSSSGTSETAPADKEATETTAPAEDKPASEENAPTVFIPEAKNTQELILEVDTDPSHRDKRFVETADYAQLKETYKDKFYFGCAVSERVMGNNEYTELTVAQFNSYTAENAMKPDSGLDWKTAAKNPEFYKEHAPVNFNRFKNCLDYAQAHNMKVRGHTLVWHSQTPEEFFHVNYDKASAFCDKELMLKRMENYIKDVLEWTNANYPGLIYAWDVVNEAIDDGSGMRKQSNWYKVVGEDFVAKAFEYARKYAAPGVKLFYNDYNAYQARKQRDILKVIKPIAEAGNLDGVGMQSHLGLYLNPNDFMKAVKKYHDELGCEIHITELDVGNDKKKVDDWEKKQADFMTRFFTALQKTIDEGVPVTSVTIWGLTDDMSWRQNEGALLFEMDLTKKPAFDAIIEAKK